MAMTTCWPTEIQARRQSATAEGDFIVHAAGHQLLQQVTCPAALGVDHCVLSASEQSNCHRCALQQTNVP